MNEQQIEKVLFEYFPVDWRCWFTDEPGTAEYHARVKSLQVKVTFNLVDCPDGHYWVAAIFLYNSEDSTASAISPDLDECVKILRDRWREFLDEARSLTASSFTRVQTEEGFEFSLQPNGKWTDGDLIFNHCPTDGFFMHEHHGRVLQLKATSQVANGKFFLSEDVEVSSDDMRDMGYWELVGHLGYVGEPPEPSEVFVVQSEQEWNAVIAKIEALHGVEPYCPIYSDQRNSKVWLHVHDEKAGKFFRYYIENRMISDLLDR